MKTAIFLFFILVMFASVAKAGLPPTTAAGQNQSNITTFNFKVPNNQATLLGGATLLETGNTNILANPSFEHLTVTTGWTSAVTGTAVNTLTEGLNTTFELGKKRLNFSCAGGASGGVCSIRQDVNTSKAIQGIALAYLSTSSVSAVKLKPRVNAATVSGLEVSTQALTEALYKVPFILGTESSGIEIEITASAGQTITGTVDDTFVGAVDLKADVPTVIRDAVIDATNGAMTYSIASLAIKVSSTLTTLNRGVISVDNSGSTTKFVALKDCTVNISWTSNMATAGNSLFFRKNGTIVVTGTQSPSSNTRLTASGEFDLVKGDFLELYSSSTTTAGSLSLTAIHSSSGSVYTSTNADTDWASCNFSTLAWQGLGTVTNNLECKRQGSDLLMRGSITLGTLTGSVAQFPLPTWNGTQLSIKSGASAVMGRLLKDSTTANSAKDYNLVGVAGNAFLNASYPEYALTVSPASTGQTGSGLFAVNSLVLYYENARIPISGWTNSNIIIGQFNGLESCTDSYECTDTFSAKVSAAGVVSDENVDWISGNASLTDTSQYTLTFNSSIFTVAPNCIADAFQASDIAQITASSSPSSSTAVSTRTGFQSAGGNYSKNPYDHRIICQKQGADYIGKTAKAVASDQNIATPGVTKVKACYYAFGGASATLASPTNCTGTCTEVVDTCGTVSVPTRSGTGLFTNLTFASGTFSNSSYIKCDCESYDTGTGVRDCVTYFDASDQTWSSNSNGGAVLNIATTNTAGTLNDAYVSVKCEGQAP